MTMEATHPCPLHFCFIQVEKLKSFILAHLEGPLDFEENEGTSPSGGFLWYVTIR